MITLKCDVCHKPYNPRRLFKLYPYAHKKCQEAEQLKKDQEDSIEKTAFYQGLKENKYSKGYPPYREAEDTNAGKLNFRTTEHLRPDQWAEIRASLIQCYTTVGIRHKAIVLDIG